MLFRDCKRDPAVGKHQAQTISKMRLTLPPQIMVVIVRFICIWCWLFVWINERLICLLLYCICTLWNNKIMLNENFSLQCKECILGAAGLSPVRLVRNKTKTQLPSGEQSHSCSMSDTVDENITCAKNIPWYLIMIIFSGSQPNEPKVNLGFFLFTIFWYLSINKHQSVNNINNWLKGNANNDLAVLWCCLIWFEIE